MVKRLEDLVKRKGPLSDKKLAEVRQWLDEEWESQDIDRNAVALIARLLETCSQPCELHELKIRDKDTGLYSSGGWNVHFGPIGKSWDRMDEVLAHLKMLERGDRYHPKMKVPANWEIVRFDLTERGTTTPARAALGKA